MTRLRVPLVLQGSDTECAPACLAMVATAHGHHLSLREAAQLCPAGRDGATAAALARAARNVGLTVSAYRTAPGLLPRLPLPVVAHWGSDHFVVVDRVRRGRVHLADPARGRRRITMNEFDAGRGQVLLAVSPGPDFTSRPPSTAPFWRRYLQALFRLPGSRLAAGQLLAVSAVLQLLGLALPLLAGVVVDRLAPAPTSSVLTLLGIGVVVVFAAHLVSSYLRSALIIYLQGRLDTHAMVSFSAHLLALPLSYFQRRSAADIMLRASSIGILRDVLTAQTLTAALDLAVIGIYLAVMATIDLPVTGVVTIVIAAQVALLAVTLPLARDRMSAELSAQAQSYGRMTETVEGVTTIKAAAAEDRAQARWSELFLTWIRTVISRNHLTAALDTASTALRTLTPLLVLWLGATRLASGQLSAGTAIALTWLAAAVVVPLAVLAANGQRLQHAGAQLQRLADVFDTPAELSESSPTNVAPNAAGRIELRDVAFRYDTNSPPVLRGIDLVIAPGSRVAIVGPSGTGKSTLALLLLGLHQPTAGTVTIDGTDLTALDVRALRRQVGTVLQEPALFAGTISENIAFHDSAVGHADIERAARLACLHDEITAMQLGYRTRLTERGGGLSGGQRQRLAIARALVRRPRLLLLDEATSHLDAVTEAAIHRNLATLDCSQIIIAHRLSTVRDADLIVVLDQGKVSEQGSHTDLLDRAGRYADLVAAQLGEPPSAVTAAPSPTDPGGATARIRPRAAGRR
ncbi:peptidase domain-containing ABC transporter [Solwaraspora sp. WMMD792]|uniref:peptidase domain-containing ABC transporter n=1 Tax=Solwaraspora sp. WMMD792 TaxID=3016099 RepID=UPI0024173874|nr:peptidase domain-containing ABC transporter [Solwaraspora sp. WMMD792]MDG4771672.1 peptidase domain-containing ABC transporter [Solwaraspora sp. WMMD792]